MEIRKARINMVVHKVEKVISLTVSPYRLLINYTGGNSNCTED